MSHVSAAKPVPDEILAQHIIVLGKTRSGKSSVMRLLVEGLLERRQPVCIVDPKGDWWGIKLAADGRRPGYPVIIFGGEHADVPINEHAGAHVAELFATGNRPCLIDLGGWMVAPRTRFWIDFASTLFKLTKGERWLAVDEVHHFAPKGKVFDAEAGKALHWANRLSSEGLGKGLKLIEASQRPQKVHNDKLTSAETLIAMRVLHPSDRGAVADWIKGCGDSEGDEVLNSLAQMERGEAWVWSPEIGLGPKRVKFPMFQTYDSFRPQTVEDAKSLKGWAAVDLDEVRAKMAATIEKAKADDPRELRKRIVELERALQKPAAPVVRAERASITPAQIARIEKIAEKLSRTIVQESMRFEAISKGIEKLTQAAVRRPITALTDAAVKFGLEVRALAVAAVAPPSVIPVQLSREERAAIVFDKKLDREIETAARKPAAVQGGALPKGERLVLVAVAQYAGGVGRDQLTVLTGYKRSTRDAYVQRLRERNYVEINGEVITATTAGYEALGPSFTPLPTGGALREHWMAKLPSGERRVLEVLVAAYPDVVDRDDITQRTNFKRSTRDAYLQRLVSRRLVVLNGKAPRASEELF